MDRSRTRRLIGRLLILALAAGILGFAVSRYRNLQASKNPLKILALDDYHDVTGKGKWAPNKELPPDLSEAVLKSYIKAWTAWNLALLGDKEQRLERHFSGPALSKILEGLDKQTGRVMQRDIEHQLTLRFLSDDFTVIEFSDHLTLERKILEGRDLLAIPSTPEDYQVLMILQDGLWRVEQWKRKPPKDK